MTLFNRTRKLLSPEPVVDDGKGGGGGNTDDTAGFSKAQLEFLGGVFNQVVTSHLKRQPTVADQLKDFKWEDVLTPVVQKLVPAPDEKSGGKGKPELSEYEKQLAKLTNDFQASEQKRIDAENRAKASETARRIDAGKMRLRSALTGHVNEAALDHVINHLTVVNNRLTVDEDGNARIRVKRAPSLGMLPEDMEIPIEDALKDILSESDMKIFLPAPRGTGGSNPGPGGKVTSASFVGEAKTDAEKIHRAMVREQELRAKFGIQG